MPNTWGTYAWLVARVDTSVSPPVIDAVGICSEPRPTMNGLNRYTTVVVVDSQGHDYAEARQNLLNLLLSHNEYAWCRPLYNRNGL